ncbi:hypothetical protein [Kangiella spongicola]|uniref:Uncharacterized protein n=1 Tax=Kangiella spongicola TaxID=796379 RepID=A0A318D2W6_9GAMM|nr:hypothetical protein [Kangiella spongicola]PXF63606.1 hypothetical protein DL796_00165 [Kangiella spongicola]
MFEQYKMDQFPAEQLNKLTNELRVQGFEIETKWKKGSKATDDISEANLFELKVSGKWVLRQQQKAGTVRLSRLNKEQKNLFLSALKKHGLYTKPDWTLGLVLTSIYFILLFVALADAPSKLYKIGLPIAMVAMLCFIGIALIRAKQIIPDGTNFLVWIIGILAVLISAPLSVINIPLIHTIYRYGLYRRVNTVEKVTV